MKKLYSLSLFLGGLLALSSCSVVTDELDSEKTIGKINEIIEKKVDTDNYKIMEVWIRESDKLTNSYGYVTITLKGKDNHRYTQAFASVQGNKVDTPLERSNSSTKWEMTYEDFTGITSADLDPKLVISQINDAKKQIPEEYRFRSVGKYMIRADYKTAEKETTFTLNVIEKGKSTSVQGKSLMTTYYEVEFIGLADGTAKMKTEEE